MPRRASDRALAAAWRTGLTLVLLALATFGAVASAGVPLRIVAFGTSLTAKGGWQQPLASGLQACLDRPVEIATIARSGATSDWGLSVIERVVAEAPSLILIEFYSNDAALNRFMPVSRSSANMASMIDILRHRLPRAQILMMAMNPISGVRGFIRPLLGSYIDAQREVATQRGAGFVDFRPAWLALSQSERDRAIPDGAHPTHVAASAIIVPQLLRTLGGDQCDGAALSAQGEVR